MHPPMPASIAPSPLLGQVLRAAGYLYSTWGWTSHPLANDANGFPKRPIVGGWPDLRLPWLENLYPLPWQSATGIGLVLGPASGNLAVLDLDDPELGEAAFVLLAERTRCIRTIRKRGHVYFIEEAPSKSTSLEVNWHGRTIKVELKATGTQVAAPPTPGYEHVGAREQKPMVVSSIRAAWESLARALGVQEAQAPTDAGYPPPWQATVHQDQRNKSIYVEAHRLREAKMPLDQALSILQARWEMYYQQGGQTWQEVAATIRSAYRKAQRQRPAPRINLEAIADDTEGKTHGG